MKRIALALILLAASVAVPATAAAQAPSDGMSIPVVGTASGGTFTGIFELQRFAARGGELTAVGTLTGTLTNTATGVTTSIVRTISLPAVVTQATCEILHLDLGPLSLDLLGLQVNLSRIVLDITAESGPGNLLGNLLCAVANLLNDPSGLARLLNQILAAIG
ncbi:MAG: hypothetical protein ACRD1U_17990 [Vicinamibacterales bacterium]